MPIPIAAKLKKNYKAIWWIIFILLSLPAVNLALLYSYQGLGINPLQTLQHSTGRWALIMLLITLSITPVRRFAAIISIKFHLKYGKRLSDWNWIIRLRKMLGLYCFFYATLHLCVYIFFDLALEWQWALSDLQEKNYIVLGLFSYLFLIPLAVTSHSTIMRSMGKSWRKLHRLIYFISVMVMLHFIWSAKSGRYEQWIFAAIILLLLSYRVIASWRIKPDQNNDNGMEVPERN